MFHEHVTREGIADHIVKFFSKTQDNLVTERILECSKCLGLLHDVMERYYFHELLKSNYSPGHILGLGSLH